MSAYQIMPGGIEIYGQELGKRGKRKVKKQLSFAGALSERLDLPGESLGELKLSVVGARRALVENHRGMLACTEELIALRGARCTLTIRGAELRIEAMNERELVISGRIALVQWE